MEKWKWELPQVGLEPTTLCTPDRCSTNWATMYMCFVALSIHFVLLLNHKVHVPVHVKLVAHDNLMCMIIIVTENYTIVNILNIY